ncbi:MAG: DUF6265 family protein [Planctomycetota bacterium]
MPLALLALLMAQDRLTAPTSLEEALFALDGRIEHVAPLVDLDGDGTAELVARVGTEVAIHRGGTGVRVGSWSFPGGATPASLAWIGDVDGDGVSDLAVGDVAFGGDEPTTLAEVEPIALDAAPEIAARAPAGTPRAGRVLVLSGRDGAVLMAVIGPPDSTAAVGRFVTAVGDQSGDGVPDLGVATADGFYVFATRLASDDPFDWLPGHWRREIERGGRTRVFEEVWLEAAAGRMLGLNRSFDRDAESGGAFEYLRVERTGSEYALVAQPGGAPPVRFPAVERGPGRIVFANPDHDFPQRIEYVRAGTRLRARVGTEDEPETLRFEWGLVRGR